MWKKNLDWQRAPQMGNTARKYPAAAGAASSSGTADDSSDSANNRHSRNLGGVSIGGSESATRQGGAAAPRLGAVAMIKGRGDVPEQCG